MLSLSIYKHNQFNKTTQASSAHYLLTNFQYVIKHVYMHVCKRF